MRISDWSSYVFSSDLAVARRGALHRPRRDPAIAYSKEQLGRGGENPSLAGVDHRAPARPRRAAQLGVKRQRIAFRRHMAVKGEIGLIDVARPDQAQDPPGQRLIFSIGDK